MKKIYSIVLMATALLIGTNVWAADVTVQGNDLAALKQAISDAGASGKVTLTQPIVIDADNNATWAGIWIGTENEADAAQSITLDLAGNDITIQTGNYQVKQKDGSYKLTAQAVIPFVITKGKLEVVSSTPATIKVIKAISPVAAGTNVFFVFGTYNKVNPKGANPFSHLFIDENVTVMTENGTVIAIDALRSGGVNTEGSSTYTSSGKTKNITTEMAVITALKRTTSYGKKPAYSTDYYTSNYGFAYGALVEVKGTLISRADDATKCYGIKTNGNLAYPTDPNRTVRSGSLVYDWMSSYSVSAEDVQYAPYVHVYPSAKLQTSNEKLSDASAAAYCSGYAQWLVEGTCEGATGLYASSGNVDIQNATITSGATEWSQGTEKGHANGCGSAVVINSRNNYGGNIDVTVSGDTKISSSAGYAVEEIVNATDTKVDAITIEGGTFDGGDKGAIAISKETSTNTQSEVVVFGATVDGNVTVGETGDLSSITSANTHVTEVVIDGKSTLVVSEGAGPKDDAKKTTWAEIDALSSKDAPKDVAWTAVGNGTIASGANKYFAELQMISGTDANNMQKLTIENGASLNVKHLMMNNFAQIVVEPGAKLVVEGEQGIIAPVESNIVLKNEEGARSIFLFNPAVKSNTHPNATIELITKSWYKDADNYQWENFGVPTHNALKSITCEKVGDKTVYEEIQVFENGKWKSLGYIGGTYSIPVAQLNKPFAAYNIIAYRDYGEGAPKCIMTGELVGNQNASLDANMKWSMFGNSYTADVDVAALMNAFIQVDKGIYVAKSQGLGNLAWDAIDMATAVEDGAKIAPMQAFLLLNNGAYSVEEAINYNSMVWTPATKSAAGAPSRYADDNTAKLRVILANEQGISDNVKLRENTNVSAFEKYMNDDVNIYAMADEKNAILTSENLEDTYLGVSTVKGGEFTISFAKVAGRQFNLVDMETGAVVAIEEGETYSFKMAANTVADYRFKVVERAKVPTAIDNVEAGKSAKGIYTITGQYMGEMNVWNTLPAGVYVINGEKRVK